MKVKVAQWGNSLGVRLPKAAAESAGVTAGSELELTVEGAGFKLRRAAKTPAERMKELLDQIDPNNIPPMVEWGPDVGLEIIDDDYSRGLIELNEDAAPMTDTPKKPKPRKRDARPRRR
jgi:antitoxin MazE